MNKGAQGGKKQSGPGCAGRGRTRQAARRQRPPAGLPPQALCLRWRRQRGAGAPPSAARFHRPAARAQEESRATAASTRPRSPPGREACALLPPGQPGPRGGHTHLAGAGASAGAGGRHLRGWWGGRGEASEARTEAEGEAGGRRAGGGAGLDGGGGGDSSHSRQIASRPLRASGKGRRRGRPDDLPTPAARPASARPRARASSGGAATPPGERRGRAGESHRGWVGAGQGRGLPRTPGRPCEPPHAGSSALPSPQWCG